MVSITPAAELTGWLVDHPEVAGSPGFDQAMGFLRSPPLPPMV
jgi:hypothetical protein